MGLGEITRTSRYSASKYNSGGVWLGDDGEHPVEIIPLDGLKLNRLDVLKIDVEGMEAEVLLGARNTIRQHRPFLYVEDALGEKGRHALNLMFALGYRVWRHAPPLFQEDNFRGCKDNPFGQTLSLNLFGVPSEREPPETNGLLLGEVFPGQYPGHAEGKVGLRGADGRSGRQPDLHFSAAGPKGTLWPSGSHHARTNAYRFRE